MAIRKIVTMGDEVLNKKCRPVTEFNQRLHDLLDDLKDTLAEAQGVGLAAPQVTYIVQALRREGIPIDDSLITVEEARDAILQLVGRAPVRDGK